MEGTNCSERALLPEKSMREKLSQSIEDDFSKVTLVNTLKYFKQKSGKNECVDATIKILEHIKKENKVPKLYKTLLREIRKDSLISSWLPSYSQRDTKLLLSFSKQAAVTISWDCLIASSISSLWFSRKTAMGVPGGAAESTFTV